MLISLRSLSLLSLTSIVVVAFDAATAHAQLFGPARPTGRPLQMRQRPGPVAPDAVEDAGTLQGNERFLRENRSRSDFVGGSRQETSGFVGSTQALGVGRVPAATETLTQSVDRSAVINRSLPPLPRNAMYRPRLVVAFPTAELDTQARTQDLNERLHRWVSPNATNEIIVPSEPTVSVSLEDRRAILRGTVESEELSRKLETLLSFEPGIDEIENQLQIQPAGAR